MDPNTPSTQAPPPPTPPVQAPLPTQGVQPQPATTTPNNKFGIKSKLPLILIAVVALIAIGLASYFFLNSRTETNDEIAAKADPLLATVGKYEIHESAVRTQARLEYAPEAINKDVLQKYLDIQIERRILDLEAEKNSITVSDSEVQKIVGNSDSQAIRNSTYYDLLKSKLMASQTHNVEAFVIGFYIASFEYPQKPEYAVQRADGTKALTEIETRMRAGESPLEITKSISEKYPSLKDSIALNSLLYRSPTNEENFLNPKVIQVNTMDPSSPSFDPVYYSVVSTINTGEVKKGERTAEGSGGFVMKAVNVKRDGYRTYDEFVTAKKQEYVKVVNSL